jgi:putative SOS response-associated peptidase YedK
MSEMFAHTERNSSICHNLPMCGRYRLSRRKQLVEEYFDTDSGLEDWVPRYNIAPTQPIPVIRQNAKEPVRLRPVLILAARVLPSKPSHAHRPFSIARLNLAASLSSPAFCNAYTASQTRRSSL